MRQSLTILIASVDASDLLCLANPGNPDALEGIHGNTKLLDAGDILHHNEIRPHLHHLVSQDLRTVFEEIESVATIVISQTHRLTDVEGRKNAMRFGWCLS